MKIPDKLKEDILYKFDNPNNKNMAKWIINKIESGLTKKGDFRPKQCSYCKSWIEDEEITDRGFCTDNVNFTWATDDCGMFNEID